MILTWISNILASCFFVGLALWCCEVSEVFVQAEDETIMTRISICLVFIPGIIVCGALAVGFALGILK